MVKLSMICPLSHKLCIECELYRGQHYKLRRNLKGMHQKQSCSGDIKWQKQA